MNHPAAKFVLLGLTVFAIAYGFSILLDKGLTADPGLECTPEGGLRCVENTIEICTDGSLTMAGTCPGGCQERDGAAHCTASDGTLVAPEGTACQPGDAVCGISQNTLLVCQNGRLSQAAICPNGCSDNGAGGGLFCQAAQRESFRFAAGFRCPEFAEPNIYACGPDNQSLLRCEDGLLVAHTVPCETCVQLRTGTLTCFDLSGARIDPATGEIIAVDAAGETAPPQTPNTSVIPPSEAITP